MVHYSTTQFSVLSLMDLTVQKCTFYREAPATGDRWSRQECDQFPGLRQILTVYKSVYCTFYQARGHRLECDQFLNTGIKTLAYMFICQLQDR